MNFNMRRNEKLVNEKKSSKAKLYNLKKIAQKIAKNLFWWFLAIFGAIRKLYNCNCKIKIIEYYRS